MAKDVHESVKHALGAIGGAGLQADLYYISLLANSSTVGCRSAISLPRSNGCVTVAAKQLADPPNQNG